MGEIKKGSIAWIDGWWFVVVAAKGDTIYSICDNANNRYVNTLDEAKYIAAPYEAMRAANWREGEDELLDLVRGRSVPSDVIAEVLSGCHDDRFDDYFERDTAAAGAARQSFINKGE